MEFSRKEYWSGLPCSPPGHLPSPGVEPVSLVSPAFTGGFFTTSATWEAQLTGDGALFLSTGHPAHRMTTPPSQVERL